MIQFDGCIWLQPPTRLFTMYIYIYPNISQHISPPKKPNPKSPQTRLASPVGRAALPLPRPSIACVMRLPPWWMLENHQFHQHLGCIKQHVGFSWYLEWYLKQARSWLFMVSGMCFLDMLWDFFFVGLEFWVGKCFWCCQFCGEDIFVYKCFIKWLFVCGVYGYRPYTRGTHYETDWRGFWIWDWGVQAGSMP